MKAIQVQDLGRVQEILRVLTRNGFGQVLTRLGMLQGLPGLTGDGEEPTAPYARRMRAVLVELGPTFVKFGQVLSVRPDILPKDVLTEFQSLQDRVPPMSFDAVKEVIESELGKPWHEVFTEIDQAPLGSASIAQVHQAVLKDGRKVALKLQRPGIERTIRSDIAILYSLARLLEGRVRIPGFYTPTDIVQEFDQAITRELDFLAEARAAERMRNNFKGDPGVMIPEVLHRLSTRRLMMMEKVEGIPLKEHLARVEAEGGVDRKLAHALMDATYKQVFEHGYFHGDPHPGNLFVTDDGRLAFLDFGVTGMLTGAMQDTIVSAFTSLVFRDAETLAMTVYRAGATNDRVDLRAYREDCERLMVKYHGASLDDLANPTTLIEVVQLGAKYDINLPAEFAILARAVALIEGSIRRLLPGVDIVTEVAPYAQRLMRQRFAPERVAADAAKMILQLQTQFKDMPTHMEQVLTDLEGGRIRLITEDPDAAKLRNELAQGVLRLSLAVLAGTTTLGGFLFLALWSTNPLGMLLTGFMGVVLWISGTGIFLALGLHVFFAELLSLSWWRKRLWGLLRFLSFRRAR